uniref:Uncharacterized protein n=1 Tax=Panagrellus redivivus TaxID=6233 RepID=A0A7E4ZTB5_PANRE
MPSTSMIAGYPVFFSGAVWRAAGDLLLGRSQRPSSLKKTDFVQLTRRQGKRPPTTLHPTPGPKAHHVGTANVRSERTSKTEPSSVYPDIAFHRGPSFVAPVRSSVGPLVAFAVYGQFHAIDADIALHAPSESLLPHSLLLSNCISTL